MSERPKRITLDTTLFESLMDNVSSLPGGQVWRLLAAVHGDVKPYTEPEAGAPGAQPEPATEAHSGQWGEPQAYPAVGVTPGG